MLRQTIETRGGFALVTNMPGMMRDSVLASADATRITDKLLTHRGGLVNMAEALLTKQKQWAKTDAGEGMHLLWLLLVCPLASFT